MFELPKDYYFFLYLKDTGKIKTKCLRWQKTYFQGLFISLVGFLCFTKSLIFLAFHNNLYSKFVSAYITDKWNAETLPAQGKSNFLGPECTLEQEGSWDCDTVQDELWWLHTGSAIRKVK